MSNGSTALRVRGLGKTFGSSKRLDRLRRLVGKGPSERRRVVDDISFEVRRGEIYGVLGANGSGKSTLIRILSTLLLPDEGSVQVFGLDAVQEAMRVRAFINRVSADPSFFRSMSVYENLLFFGRVYGLSAGQIRTESPAILDRLGMEWERALVPMSQLSRGQQQKIAVARCFLTSPVLMLLDEPTTGLDPRSKREVQAFIREARTAHDATILLATHDMEEAEQLCDRVAFLVEGRIVAEGTPLELRQRVAESRSLEDIDMETVFLELTGRALADEDHTQEGRDSD